MTAWLPTPNADSECCDPPCADREGPCDPCEGCPCPDIPDSVEIVSYERQVVGRRGCKKEVFLITGCETCALIDPPTDDCEYECGLSYFASPIQKWTIGDATAVGDGCGGLIGEYKKNGILKYLVTLSTSGLGTIEGNQIADWNCKDCDCGSGVVDPPCASGLTPCGSGITPCASGVTPCGSGIPCGSGVTRPCCGSGLNGSGLNPCGSGVY
jgi:hypothetical protein